MKIITLLTDFGITDGYSAVMKGIILQICPDAILVDITHSVSPQNILEGSLVLSRSYSYFEPGTIHLAVVDPGVGTGRRPLALRIGDFYFVGPDNGLFTLPLIKAEKEHRPVEIIYLDKPAFWRKSVSPVFHGRDIFAPVAAHLGNGIPLSNLGTRIYDPVRLSIPIPKPAASGWVGHVIGQDHFGNISTNIDAEILLGKKISIQGKGFSIPHLSQTFGDGHPGELISLIDSSNMLSLSVVSGSAVELLKCQPGDPFTIEFKE